MANENKKTINSLWGELTTNRIDFTEEEISNGILYKGPVVSNQLNGLAYNIYSMIDLAQRTGGLYNSLKIYYLNNVVSVLVQRQGEAIKLENYRCINSDPKGIVNTPPIIGGDYSETDDIPMFKGGYADIANWTRVDAHAAGNVSTQRTSFDFGKKIKLITIPEVLQMAENVKDIQASLNFTIIFDRTKVTCFTLKVKGKHVKDETGSVQILPNRLGIPMPEIFFENVYSNVTDYGDVKDFHSMMPYGLRFEYGWEGSSTAKEWCIYLKLREGLSKVTIEGNADVCDVSLERDSEQASNDSSNPALENIVVPIRSNGGFEQWEEIGRIVIDSSNIETNAALQYQKGLFILDASIDEVNDNTTKKLNYPDYGMFCKMKGVAVGGQGTNPPPAAGMFMRNLGEHKIPGYSQKGVYRQAGTGQTDAIRNIKGGTGVGGAYAGKYEWSSGVFARGDLYPGGDATARGAVYATGNIKLPIKVYFDASRVVPTTNYENRPYNVAQQFYLKVF